MISDAYLSSRVVLVGVIILKVRSPVKNTVALRNKAAYQ